MKTLTKKAIADFKKSDSAIEKLIPIVIAQGLDLENMEDVVNHGIDGGFNGFIYYSETHAFAIKNRKLIVQLLEDMADELDEDVTQMVAGFGVFQPANNSRYTETGRRGIISNMDKEDKTDLYKFLGGGKPSQGTITNVMAWFAAEEVARYLVDNYKMPENS